jgi:phage RecT family recombinase
MAKPPAVRSERPVDVFKSHLSLAMPTLRHMIPAHVTPEKFQAMVVTAVAYDKNLLECSTESLIRETAQAAELGLSLNKSLREADILTVWNGSAQRKEAQMRPRYMGLMKLARQSGEISDIYAHVVHQGDFFEYELGLDKALRHRPVADGGEVTHAYVVWQTKDGIKAFEVLDRKRLDNIRDRSEGYKAFKANKIKSTPWESDYEEMCRKTAVRAGSKYMPISNEKWAAAVSADNRGDSSDPEEFAGDYTDVTDTTPAAPSEAAKTATTKLEERIAPAVSDRLEPTEGFEGPDYAGWGKDAVAVLTKLAPGKRDEWRKKHADIIAAAPEDVATRVAGV